LPPLDAREHLHDVVRRLARVSEGLLHAGERHGGERVGPLTQGLDPLRDLLGALVVLRGRAFGLAGLFFAGCSVAVGVSLLISLLLLGRRLLREGL
jgi:hypothetical protein